MCICRCLCYPVFFFFLFIIHRHHKEIKLINTKVLCGVIQIYVKKIKKSKYIFKIYVAGALYRGPFTFLLVLKINSGLELVVFLV